MKAVSSSSQGASQYLKKEGENYMSRFDFFALCRNLTTIKDFPFSLEGGQTSAEVIQEEC